MWPHVREWDDLIIGVTCDKVMRCKDLGLHWRMFENTRWDQVPTLFRYLVLGQGRASCREKVSLHLCNGKLEQAQFTTLELVQADQYQNLKGSSITNDSKLGGFKIHVSIHWECCSFVQPFISWMNLGGFWKWVVSKFNKENIWFLF